MEGEKYRKRKEQHLTNAAKELRDRSMRKPNRRNMEGKEEVIRDGEKKKGDKFKFERYEEAKLLAKMEKARAEGETRILKPRKDLGKRQSWIGN